MYGNNDRGSRSFGGPQRFAPVKVGDELDVKIEAVGEKGDGIAKKDGFVIFVPGVNSGDEVKIKVNKVLRKVGFAEVIGASSGSKGAAKSAPAEDEETEEEEKEISEKEMENDSDDFGEDSDEADEDEEAPADEEESK